MVDRFYPLWTAEPLMCFCFFPSGFLIFCHVFSMFIGPRCPWSDLCVRMSVTPRGFAYLTDVTLADEDTNSILPDNANRAIQGNFLNFIAYVIVQCGNASDFAGENGVKRERSGCLSSSGSPHQILCTGDHHNHR